MVSLSLNGTPRVRLPLGGGRGGRDEAEGWDRIDSHCGVPVCMLVVAICETSPLHSDRCRRGAASPPIRESHHKVLPSVRNLCICTARAIQTWAVADGADRHPEDHGGPIQLLRYPASIQSDATAVENSMRALAVANQQFQDVPVGAPSFAPIRNNLTYTLTAESDLLNLPPTARLLQKFSLPLSLANNSAAIAG